MLDRPITLQTPPSWSRAFFTLGLLVCTALFLFAARGDLWMDEIWSLSFAEAAQTPWDIVVRFPHDNNHVLNTLYLYLVGQRDALYLYRMLAVASGAGSLVLLIRIAAAWGFLESAFILVLAGSSCPLILYFSEARGYAPALFFSLLALHVLQGHRGPVRWTRTVLFWLACIFGVLSHLTFLIVFLSLAAFLIHQTVRTERPSTNIRRILGYLLVPSAFIAAFLLLYARHMLIGGGPDIELSAEISRGAGALMGIPDGLSRYLGPPLVALIVCLIGYVLIDQKNPLFTFFIFVLVIAPALLLIITRPAYFHFRYFIVCFPFYLLSLSILLARACRSERTIVRVLVLLVMGLYLTGQAYRIAPLLQYGRGGYRAIISTMAVQSTSDVITVASDHDFRNQMILSFYTRFLRGPQRIEYFDQAYLQYATPEWFIVHDLDDSVAPRPSIVIPPDRLYDLVRTEPSSTYSGFRWSLYHYAATMQGSL